MIYLVLQPSVLATSAFKDIYADFIQKFILSCLLLAFIYLNVCQPSKERVSSYANCIIFSPLIKEKKTCCCWRKVLELEIQKKMFKLLQKFRPLNYEHFQFQSGFWEFLSKSKVLLFFEVLSSHMKPLLGVPWNIAIYWQILGNL